MTPDVNVLVAASRTDHLHHGAALGWLDDALDACAGGARFTLLPTVAAGFLRIVTHPRVFRHPTPITGALAFLDSVETAPGVSRASHDGEWPLFLQLCRIHELTGNDIPDAWIAAAVVARRERLATFDGGFRRLLAPEQLHVLEAGAIE